VRYEANYRSRVWFTDPVEIRLAVAGLGRSSATLSFEIHGPAGVVADGEMTIVHTASSSEASVPWPEATQAALAGNGQPAAAAGGGTTSAA
jgi:acyl-CoA thioesterase FadM